MEKAEECRIVLVTADSYEKSLQIARNLVYERLAACCSIVNNLTSVFNWEFSMHERQEFLMIFKTTEDKLEELEKRVTELHNYEAPEIIAIKLDSAAAPYLNWLKANISEPKSEA